MKALRLLLLWAVALTGLPAAYAQVVTADPVFFTETTPVTLTFDASKGDAGLKDFTGDVYIWTGVISDKSASNTDWKAVVGTTWTPPIAKEKMTRSAANPNLYTITFTPRTYYDKLPTGDKILKLAMLFRSEDGTKSGRDTGGKDILVDVAQTSALSARITAPTTAGATYFVNQNAKVTVTGSASAAATLTLTLNGTQVHQQTNATTLSKEVTLTQAGSNVVKLTATSGATTATDEITIFASPAATVAALPAGAKKDGVTYLNDGKSAVLALTAPGKSAVYAIGDFNNWQPGLQYQLKKTSATDDVNTRWWVQINGLTPGQEYAYQYQVDGVRVADPYTEKVLDPNNDQFITAAAYPNLKAYPAGKTTGIVSVLQSNEPAYTWQVTNFQRPSRLDLVIYELHVRDFVKDSHYKTVIDSLAYLKRLGINTIELMPVNEFEGNDSWGYNPSFYFAPDKYYGTKNDLKRLIDEAHKLGIAVVLDMVLNHSFGQSPMVQMYFANGKPTANSPWFNADATHPFNVGYDFNHESAYTRYFSKRVMEFWLKEYKIDGYRFDLSKGFTQKVSGENVGQWNKYDASRVAIWKDYHDHMVSVDATMYPIMEHLSDNDEEKALSDMGMMFWGKMVSNYSEATMGYNTGDKSNLNWGYYQARSWTKPNLVTILEDHDEERLIVKNMEFGNASGTYSTKNLNTALARVEAAAAVFFTQPGARMFWQFAELGYDVSINQNGRTGRKPFPEGYYQNPNRRHLYDVFRSLITLRTQEPVFENYTSYKQNLSGALKSLYLSNAEQNVAVLVNFDVVAAAITPSFQKTGTWYSYLDGTTLNVTNTTAPITLQPGEYRVYLSKKVAVPANTVLPTKAERAALALSFTAVPNPAASAVRLQYTLPQAAQVSVSVVNALGATVRTIPVSAKQPTGSHELLVPVQDLANGIYIVRLQAAGKVATTRLLVQH